MTRKRVGEGLVEAFSTQCGACEGRGFIVHSHPVEHPGASDKNGKGSKRSKKSAEGRRAGGEQAADHGRAKEALSAIAAATRKDEAPAEGGDDRGTGAADGAPKAAVRTRRKRGAATAPSQEAASAESAPSQDSAAPSGEAPAPAAADPAPSRDSAAPSEGAASAESAPSQDSAAPSEGAQAPAAAEPAPAAKPRRRRRAASAGSVEPEAAPVLELPERVAVPVPAAATMAPEEIALPEPTAQERPKRRRRAVSTGIVDAG